MKIFTRCKNTNSQVNGGPCEGRAPTLNPNTRKSSQAGNVFFALFAAVAMVGAVGYSFNSVIKGPIASMTEATKKTLAENTVLTSSRVAVVSATTQQPLTVNGDCDADGFVEPLPFRDAGTNPKPTGGGYMPTGMMPTTLDPWNSEYGYCAWDSGSVRTLCGGAAGRIIGSPTNNQYSIAIISAGKDKIFQTSCNAYVDTTPVDGKPDTQMLVRAPGSDDIVLGYTYAEANDLGNGLWKINALGNAQINKNLDVAGGGTFTNKVELTGNTITGGGLILPGDPGDNSLTGPCNSANDKQLRRNTSTTPPTIEICDFVGGLGWNQITGGSGGTPGTTTGQLISHWKFNETTGTTALDSISGLNGTLLNGPAWNTDGILSGAIYFSGATNESVRVDRSAKLEPTAFTIATWFKADGVQPVAAPRLMTKWNQAVSGNSWSLHFTNNNATTIEFGTRHPPNTINTTTSPLTLSNGVWYHAVAVYDPAGPAPQKKLYINGQLSQSATLTDAVLYDTGAASRVYLGNSGDNNRFKGYMDDTRFYNYALSDSQVRKIYELGIPKIDMTTTKKSGAIFGWGADNGLGNGADGGYVAPGPAEKGKDFVQLAANGSNSCGVKADGSAWCWGSGNVTGNGTWSASQVPFQVPGMNNVVKMTVNFNHACALKKTGEAWCWGVNSYGELGNGAAVDSNVPVKVNVYADFIDLEAGYDATCGLRRSGDVWCWGRGNKGQLGDGLGADSLVPVKVSTVTDFKNITGGYYGFCGIRTNGTAYCWGEQTAGEFGTGTTASTYNSPVVVSTITDFVKIDMNTTLSCALRATGQIMCTGADTMGGLGNGTPLTDVNVYTAITGPSDFVDVAVGAYTACGVRKNGEAWCWGWDNAGQVGNGDTAGNPPAPVKVLGGNFFKIAGGYSHFIALVDETANLAAPVNIYQGKIASGSRHACMIQTDGTLWCWGWDSMGQLGNGPSITADQSSPSRVSDPGPWTQVATGYQSTCAIKANGTLWCWGDDVNGLLGNGAGGNSDVPALSGTSTDQWVKISIGVAHACGIKNDGTAWCWGDGNNGQLGNGATGSSSQSPTQVVGGGTWTDILVGNTSTCGVKSDGSGYCWGQDLAGQLGNGAVLTADQSSPSAIEEVGPWLQIAASANSNGLTCGVKKNGSLWCWGSDLQGAIGNGANSTNDRVSPTLVSDAGPFTYVSPFVSTIALKTDGTAVSWGQALNGALGQGSTASIPGGVLAPAPVVGGIKFAAISSGNSVCGISFEGKAYCWGADTNGRLGNGTVLTAAQGWPSSVDFTPAKAPFLWSDLGTAFTAQGNVAIGTTLLTDVEGGASGLSFPGSGNSLLRQSAAANQFGIEANDIAGGFSGFSAQVSLGIKQPTTDGLVGLWKFDEIGATTAADSVAGNDATLTATAPTFLPGLGKLNGSLNFTGAASTGASTLGSSAYNSSAGTWSFWMKTDKTWDTDGTSVNNDALLLRMSALNGAGFGIYLSPTDYLGFGAQDASTTVCSGGNVVSINNNAWHLITVTFSQKNGDSSEIYFDGSNVGSCTNTGPWSFSSTILSIGAMSGDTYFEEFKGQMDDLRIYNRKLTSAEITAMYNAGNAPATARMFGLNGVTGSLEFARNNDSAWLHDLMPDMEVANTGFVGIGTGGSPGAMLDVRGGIRIGNNAGGCSATNAGELKYLTGTWSYCAGAGGWQPLGGGAGTVPWDVGTRSIGMGTSHTCGIKSDGSAWCWGLGTSTGGKIGDGNGNSGDRVTLLAQVDTNTSSPGWKDWIKISVGSSQTCGIRANGEAYCWGAGAAIGNNNGTNADPGVIRPVKVHDNLTATGWSDWVDISTGKNSMRSCGVRANGTAWCWGTGQNGDGTNGNNRPRQVQTETGPGAWTDWVKIRVGYNHNCGIRANGTAWCFGTNTDGQLGNNSTTNTTRPVQVVATNNLGAPWTDWVDIAPGNVHTCGVRANGEAYCWGADGQGQLGVNATTLLDNGITPALVYTDAGSSLGWQDWVNISTSGWNGTGGHYSCGVRSNGTAWCWGYQQQGQLGNGSSSLSNRPRPAQIQTTTGPGGWSDWVVVEAGSLNGGCGIRAGGTAWCWGLAANGRLGNGLTTPNQTRPVQVMP